jgi:hypothetical protein
MRLYLEKILMSPSQCSFGHLKSANDLITSYEAVRAGFVSLALEKNRRATPFVAEARTLQALSSKAKRPRDLLKIAAIQNALSTASGLSEKAIGHLTEKNKKDAIEGLIQNFLEPAGDKFVEELVFRFLLTRGDTLGGSMRNIGGVLAQRKLSRAILSHLSLSDIAYTWLHSQKNVWFDQTPEDSDIELFLRGISWNTKGKSRTILFNLTVPCVGNNVDLSVLSCSHTDIINKKSTANILKASQFYIALGELKGGIDPAGADEHWKTARTALLRIRDAFGKAKHKPHLFFIGAAIEKKMAGEIWSLLKNKSLENAANLTNDNHLATITKWLCSL